MQNASLIRRGITVLGLGVALAAAFSQAAFAGTLEIRTDAFKEVEQTGPDGKKEVKRVPLTRATPGTEVIYVISYRNVGTKSATDAKIEDPVPKGLVYQFGSAMGDGSVAEFSVDGGKHFGAFNTLKVSGPDGQQHDAQARDVTAIRWTLKEPVKAGGEGTVSFRAMLP